MPHPENKTYSLKEASNIIKDEIGAYLSKKSLMEYGSDNTLKISIHNLENRELRYIQLNRNGDNCKREYCDLLTDGEPKCVISSSNHMNIINPAEKTVFPFVGYHPLQDFITGQKNTSYKSDKCKAFDKEGNTIEISIVVGKWATNPKLNDWLKERHIADQYYYEASSRININKRNLCITSLELKRFIEFLQLKMIKEKSESGLMINEAPKLYFDIYTLDKALTVLASYDNQFKDIDDIYQLVNQGEIQLCLYKPNWNYVQIDKKGHELDEVYCKPLGKYVLIPEDKKTTGTDTAAFFAGNKLQQYHGVINDIYPIIKPEFIIEMNDRGNDRLFIWDSHLLAKQKGEEITLARVNLTYFPVKDNSGNVDFKRLDAWYAVFMEWLEAEYPLIFNDYKNYCPNPLSNKYPFDEPRFFSTTLDRDAITVESKGKRQVNLMANREDLRITKDELKRYIQTSQSLINNDILKSTHIHETELTEEKTKPLDKLSLTIRIKEELEAIEIELPEILIPRGRKAIVAKIISDDSDGKFKQKSVENRISYLGYRSEYQPAIKNK